MKKHYKILSFILLTFITSQVFAANVEWELPTAKSTSNIHNSDQNWNISLRISVDHFVKNSEGKLVLADVVSVFCNNRKEAFRIYPGRAAVCRMAPGSKTEIFIAKFDFYSGSRGIYSSYLMK